MVEKFNLKIEALEEIKVKKNGIYITTLSKGEDWVMKDITDEEMGQFRVERTKPHLPGLGFCAFWEKVKE